MAKKSIPAVVNETDDAEMFVRFGDRGLSFKVGFSDQDTLQGHALTLSMALHAMQRVVAHFDFDSDDGSFNEDDRKHAHVGLEFISGVVSEFLLEVGQ